MARVNFLTIDYSSDNLRKMNSISANMEIEFNIQFYLCSPFVLYITQRVREPGENIDNIRPVLTSPHHAFARSSRLSEGINLNISDTIQSAYTTPCTWHYRSHSIESNISSAGFDIFLMSFIPSGLNFFGFQCAIVSDFSTFYWNLLSLFTSVFRLYCQFCR